MDPPTAQPWGEQGGDWAGGRQQRTLSSPSCPPPPPPPSLKRLPARERHFKGLGPSYPSPSRSLGLAGGCPTLALSPPEPGGWPWHDRPPLPTVAVLATSPGPRFLRPWSAAHAGSCLWLPVALLLPPSLALVSLSHFLTLPDCVSLSNTE